MKKIYFSGFFFLIVLFSVNCQENFSQKITLGIRGGVTHSKVYYIPKIGAQPVYAPGGGFFINYFSQPHVGIQLELNSITHGWKDKTDTTGTYSRVMRYLEIPLLTHVEIEVKHVVVCLDVGPYISFFQGQKEKYDPNLRYNIVTDSVVYGQRNFIGLEPASTFEYGFLAGMGLGVNTKIGQFRIDVRYTNSLTNIFEKYPTGNFSFSYSQNVFAGLTYSYAIKLKIKQKRYIIAQ